jgi:hypothetical protein
MPTIEPIPWEQLTPEQQASIVAILVQMLVHYLTANEAGHERK